MAANPQVVLLQLWVMHCHAPIPGLSTNYCLHCRANPRAASQGGRAMVQPRYICVMNSDELHCARVKCSRRFSDTNPTMESQTGFQCFFCSQGIAKNIKQQTGNQRSPCSMLISSSKGWYVKLVRSRAQLEVASPPFSKANKNGSWFQQVSKMLCRFHAYI